MTRPAAGIETYKHERLLWQSVLQQNGLTIQCKTRAHAVQMIQRLHVFRALDRKNSFDQDISIFDNYIIKHPGKSTIVLIEPRSSLDDIVVLRPDGTPADLQAAQQAIDMLRNLKSDEYLVQHGIVKQKDLNQINPDEPLDLE